jgi:LacI family transcriptional regulator
MEAAERLNYSPNYFARSLRRNRSMSVGVLAPDLSDGYFTRVMSGVVEELNLAHYFYFTVCHDWKREMIEQYPRMLVERGVDGLLLLNTPADHIDVPVPVVAISTHIAAENVTKIVFDHHLAVEQALTHLYSLGHHSAVQQALAHLYALGHRRIAFMRGPRAIPDSEFRWEAIQQVAREIGLKMDPALVIHIDSASWSMKTGYQRGTPEIGYESMQALLKTTRDFTAIFCFNDITAIGAIRALKDEGLVVPEDVSVVGFDDIQSAAYTTPSLTTVHQPLLEMGMRGAHVLLERIAKREVEYPTEIVMAPELVVRESTGPASDFDQVRRKR